MSQPPGPPPPGYPPGQYPSGQYPAPQYPAGGYPAQGMHPGGPSDAQLRGKKLVTLSTLVLLAGAVLLFAGCGGAIALKSGAVGIVGGVLGMGTIIAAAIVGQIGRAYQGRII